MKQNLEPLTNAEKEFIRRISQEQKRVESKFPLIFGLTATFGLVSILYSFEKIIDKVPLLSNNPWILMVVGLSLLIATGATYRKLN